jgi:pantoate--beta-alanine ligase
VIRADTKAQVSRDIAAARADGKRIAFVPTMGYLHEGHLALCEAASDAADFVVMSVFVNPLQFGPTEDFERYPRDLERDAALAESRNVDLLFAPDVAEMYPHGDSTVLVTAGVLEDRLCGAYRPGHFRGVLTVVAKLFHMVRPDVAIFGQKDLQQLVLLERMVRDLDFDLEIRAAPIVREPDGVALSSRNVYLPPQERAAAPALYRALRAGQAAFAAATAAAATGGVGVSADAVIGAARAELQGEPLIELQYLQLVDVHTLADITTAVPGNALAIAAYLGRTRLIDNVIL